MRAVAQNVDTPAALDGALAAAKAFNGPTLIAAQVDAHGLPAKVTGAALAAAARSMKSGMAMIGSDMR